MEFNVRCDLPVRIGDPVEVCAEHVDIHHELPDRLIGDLTLDGRPRLVSVSIDHDSVTAVQVNSTVPGDTFEGVSLGQTPVKIQRDLVAQGIPAVLNIDYLSLTSKAAGFYLDDDRIVSVDWPSQSGEEESDEEESDD